MPDPTPKPNTSTLLHLCGVASSVNRATSAFVNRGLTQFTVGRLSQIQAIGKPTEPQFAYGGYKSAIEHFVSATANKTKYLTSAEEAPLPDDYIPSVPIPLPSLVFRVGAAIKGPLFKRLTEKLASEGLVAADVGGEAGTAFELLRPSWNTVYSIGVKAFNRNCARLDGRAQFGDLLLFKPIYQFIDAFLATNTYPYKKDKFRKSDDKFTDDFEGLAKSLEIRTHDNLYRDGFGSKAPKLVKLKQGDFTRRRIDDTETQDLTPETDEQNNIHQTVFIAKPSPLPSSTSWGAPSSVPFTGGLLFPYFHGMLQHDLPGSRDIIGRLMFRCLGSKSVTPRAAYTEIRNKMGSVLNTDAGLILSHILKGMDLALDSQAQLYLIFDKQEYLGFSLLGEEFAVFMNGKWHAARTPEELRTDLATLATADQAMEKLVQKLNQMSVGMDGLDSITKDNMKTPYDILSALSKLTVTDDEVGKAQVSDIYSLLGKCNLPGNYLPITENTVKWAIEQMTSKIDEAFDKEKFPIYIPPNNWFELLSKQYAVLAAFGPRSISFRNQKGDEFKIPDIKDEKCKWALKEGKAEQYGLMIYVKTIFEACNDWDELVKSGKVRMDFTERAGSVRAHRWLGEKKKVIWETLWENKAAFGKGAAEVETTQKNTGKGKEKQVAPEIDPTGLEALL